MICGALQTLNEEACEDVLEESSEQLDPDIPQTTLIPPSPEQQPPGELHFPTALGTHSGHSSCSSIPEVYIDRRPSRTETTVTIVPPHHYPNAVYLIDTDANQTTKI